MAIISCPECNHQVSDRAASCPQCGCPIATGSVGTITGKGVQTIEATSKTWKVLQLIGGIMIIIGMVSCMASIGDPSQDPSTTSPLMFSIGLICYIGGRFGAWWHNK